jgi:ATP-dependent DNA ligase
MARASRRRGDTRPSAADPAAAAGFIEPMEALLVEDLPDGEGWQFEPKWDGFRCLAVRADEQVELFAKSGKPLGRYFPEIVEVLSSLPMRQFIVDGELTIHSRGENTFGALQMRLHPAESRIRKLAKETPAHLTLFDMLVAPDGRVLLNLPLTERRRELRAFTLDQSVPRFWMGLSPTTRDRAKAEHWLNDPSATTDGVIAKRLDEPYRPGERAMLKVKRLRSADCVVGGFRYASNSRLVGSLLLGLYNDRGELDHVGFTSSIANRDREALTRKLEALREPPGFTGKAPGGPSRWSTERTGEWEPLRPDLVVEVRYDHVTDDRFRHGTRFLRWRPDKAPRQCTFDQLKRAASPGELFGGAG